MGHLLSVQLRADGLRNGADKGVFPVRLTCLTTLPTLEQRCVDAGNLATWVGMPSWATRQVLALAVQSWQPEPLPESLLSGNARVSLKKRRIRN